MNVDRDIVRSFLSNYTVKEYWADVDYRYGIPNGGYTFIMYNRELQANPLDECVYFNNEPCWISYATRELVCHQCNKPGHMADQCTADPEPFFPHWNLLLVAHFYLDVWLP